MFDYQLNSIDVSDTAYYGAIKRHKSLFTFVSYSVKDSVIQLLNDWHNYNIT